MVNSLIYKNPKKAVQQQAALSIGDWYVDGCLVRTFPMDIIISGVIGKCGLERFVREVFGGYLLKAVP